MRITYVGPCGDGETIVRGDQEWSARPGETVDVPDDLAATLSAVWQPAPETQRSSKE